MDRLAWVDNRTLILCHAILIAAFCMVIAGMRSFFPSLRGVTSVASGFLIGMPALLLLTREGPFAAREMAAFGAPCILISSICLFQGVLEFCQNQQAPASGEKEKFSFFAPERLRWFFFAWCGIAAVISCGCAFGWLPFNLGITTIAIEQALVRLLMSWTLLFYAGKRNHMRFFSVTFLLFALPSVFYAVSGILYPMTFQTLQHDPTQTPRFLLGLLFFCIQGVFYVLLFAGSVSSSVYEQARRDYLSGALNRRGIEEALASELARMRRTGGSFCVLMIDIDHFKSVNDRSGHATGDDAIRAVARSISDAVRVYDSVGRYGGDEFLLILPQTSSSDALLTAQRIRHGVRRQFSGPAAFPLTVSVGITCCSYPEDAREIISRADEALYDAKREGRNCERLRLPKLDAPSNSPRTDSVVLRMVPREVARELV